MFLARGNTNALIQLEMVSGAGLGAEIDFPAGPGPITRPTSGSWTLIPC